VHPSELLIAREQACKITPECGPALSKKLSPGNPLCEVKPMRSSGPIFELLHIGAVARGDPQPNE
jgi:hypothetical protein